ncbi:lysophospholipid acyltransferase family protein [Agitococcus lubricus]|uniref:KDO2-lipid IV(A) lauroyltransferase n=1 Tax=Agitococcus lubricus TaxID=1077255 RepID=A0A2T5J1N8_9GAMM|nr:lysophospholipid acyltransferase family protein [Agitococcus lubricus]PTQ90359.1 KDO2-lipid IV(A) lauroyltransferase [Agitococcus lubricus]
MSVPSSDSNNTPTLNQKQHFLLSVLYFFSRRSLAFLQGLGLMLGTIAAWFPQGPAWVIRRNLKLCFPEQSERWINQVTRQNLIHTAQTGLEFTKTWGMPADYSIAQMKEFENIELFLEAIKSPKGCLVIVPHYGNWEFMNPWVSQQSQPVIMYKPSKNPIMDKFVWEARSRLQASLVPTDEKGVKSILKTLKSGGVSILLPDHVPHDNGGIFAPFFGISVWSGILSSRLIQKTQCAVVMLSCTRLAHSAGFKIVADKVDPEVYSTDLQLSVNALNRSVEQLIRRDPSQYQWTYKRFKKCETLKNVYQ